MQITNYDTSFFLNNIIHGKFPKYIENVPYLLFLYLFSVQNAGVKYEK